MDNAEQQIGKKGKRQVDRKHIVYYLRVFESGSRTIFGHLVDISERGIMLIGDNPVEVNKTFNLRMSLPNRMKGHEEINFSAISKWCKNDTDPHLYLAGFQFEALEPPFMRLITILLRDFSQNQ